MVESSEIRVCPYCGRNLTGQPESDRCDVCSGLQDPLSRQATGNAMGPWFVRDEKYPFRPGCNYETLRRLISRGKVTSDSIIRGPTTGQFWELAGRVPSVSHLFGLCYQCSGSVAKQDQRCPICSASFEPQMDRQWLGLDPMRDVNSMASAEANTIAINSERELAGLGHEHLKQALLASRANNQTGDAVPSSSEQMVSASPGTPDQAETLAVLAGKTVDLPHSPHSTVDSGTASIDQSRLIGQRERRLRSLVTILAVINILAVLTIFVITFTHMNRGASTSRFSESDTLMQIPIPDSSVNENQETAPPSEALVEDSEMSQPVEDTNPSETVEDQSGDGQDK